MANEAREKLIVDVGLAIRQHQNAVDQLDEAAMARLGVNRTDGRCLDIIDQRARLTAGELAAESGLSTGAITTVLDRLEAKGYVRRVRAAEDRRKVLVELTEKARRRSGEIYGRIAEEGRILLDRYSDEELLLIRDFMRLGREFLAGYAADVRGMATTEAPRRAPRFRLGS